MSTLHAIWDNGAFIRACYFALGIWVGERWVLRRQRKLREAMRKDAISQFRARWDNE